MTGPDGLKETLRDMLVVVVERRRRAKPIS
jgi:hypothetical protein